jgi:hypothetical protein
MIIAPALRALRILQAVELAWKIALARIFIRTNALAGNAWAWRIVKFVYALPYVVGCYLAGVICVWGAPLSPHVGGAVCAGIMAAIVFGSWLNQWWRG